MSTMTVQELEDDWATRHPQTTRVNAALSVDGKSWVIYCPYCMLHHHHGSDGTIASAGLREPHCADGARGKPGYYLFPDGQLSKRMEYEIRRIDAKRQRRLTRAAHRVLAQQMGYLPFGRAEYARSRNH